MIVEIITTGTELLLGEIVNENSKWLASFLNQNGYTVAYITTVGDNAERMRNVISQALTRADIVITSGGLGATQGDVTKHIGAEAIGIPYEYNGQQAERLREYYKNRGRAFTKYLERQAWFAKGAHIFENHVGTANGSGIYINNKVLIHLPGPPFEMKVMAEKEMMPWLEKQFGKQGIIYSVILSILNMTETEIEAQIMDLIQAQKNPTIALLARPGYVALRITAFGENSDHARSLIEPVASVIKSRITVSDYFIEAHAREDLVKLLRQNKMTLSTAESCTGGLIGKLLTDSPGSSEYFKGGVITYWNEAKEKVLNVAAGSLEKYTAVSAKVACEMAEGSRNLYKSDISVSTTGYAGPGIGERGENPGLVYIAVCGDKGIKVHEEHFMGDRRSIRYGAADKALYYVSKYIIEQLLGGENGC